MSLAGKTELGSHEYVVAPGVTACRMATGEWFLFRGKADLGLDFPTLAKARSWAKANLPAEVECSMDALTAVAIAEGIEPAEPGEVIKAWQLLVDTGLAWQLQGSFGRQAAALIDAGVIQRAGVSA